MKLHSSSSNILILAVALPAVLLSGVGCAGDDDAHLEAMEHEHANDQPVTSPAAETGPRTEIESNEVHYATLTGEHGEIEIHGYLARPSTVTERRPAVLLVHEWWGLNDNIRAVADRFADEGYLALAVDLYEGRVAEDREQASSLMRGTFDTVERLNDNLRQAQHYLTAELSASKIGSVGWCFGGGWSLNAAILLGGELDAAVIYYGRVTDDQERLSSIEAPILGHFGALDRGIPIDSVRAFESALRELDNPAEIHIYENADHAFANPSGTRYNETAATEAWGRTLAFFEQHLR